MVHKGYARHYAFGKRSECKTHHYVLPYWILQWNALWSVFRRETSLQGFNDLYNWWYWWQLCNNQARTGERYFTSRGTRIHRQINSADPSRNTKHANFIKCAGRRSQDHIAHHLYNHSSHWGSRWMYLVRAERDKPVLLREEARIERFIITWLHWLLLSKNWK